jgi:CDP-4-dehydro-6-deoxyglucose reductase
LVLDAVDVGELGLTPPRLLPCRIQQLERVADDVVRVWLRLPPGQTLGHRAGQYVDLIGPGGVRRSYSVANAPTPDGLLEFHIRAVDGGQFSAYWFGSARVNDLLRLRGPVGTFVLRDVAGLDLICLATGTGIAPIKAQLEELADRPTDAQPRSIAVYWGARLPSDFYWTPNTWPAAARFVPVLSRADASWDGARGHVQQVALRDAVDVTHTVVHACGSDAMVRSARAACAQAGLMPQRFHADPFVSSS